MCVCVRAVYLDIQMKRPSVQKHYDPTTLLSHINAANPIDETMSFGLINNASGFNQPLIKNHNMKQFDDENQIYTYIWINFCLQ